MRCVGSDLHEVTPSGAWSEPEHVSSKAVGAGVLTPEVGVYRVVDAVDAAVTKGRSALHLPDYDQGDPITLLSASLYRGENNKHSSTSL